MDKLAIVLESLNSERVVSWGRIGDMGAELHARAHNCQKVRAIRYEETLVRRERIVLLWKGY